MTLTTTIVRSSLTVSANGSTQVFTADGGSGSYLWSFVTSQAGASLSHTKGPSTAYTLNSGSAAGTDVVELSDGLTHVLATVTRQ